jgi:hypothetical protein
VKFWKNLIRGQVIVAQVVEVQVGGGLLVGYQGELLLLNNQSGQSWDQGDTIKLVVSTIAPLSFVIQTGSLESNRVELTV